MAEIKTSRLRLIQLELHQLELCLSNISQLEKQFHITITRDFFTDRVLHAIRMKVDKMQKADASQQAWFTYWLIVIMEENIGAGMLGFKGYPNIEGAVEIGYGIDPAYQSKGYMTEAVRALTEWAFTHPFCKVITATDVENPASSRLLEKLGAIQVGSNDKSTSWEIRKTLT